jgi:hypothetical protein
MIGRAPVLMAIMAMNMIIQSPSGCRAPAVRY